MAALDFLTQMKLNTDRLPDKVAWRASPTYNVPLAPGITAYTEYVIPHGLPFTPMVIGTYSDDGFVTSYDFGVGPYGPLPTYGFTSFTMIAHVYSDPTNVTIRVISHNSARTISFHLVGLYPARQASDPAWTIAAPPVQDDFLLTTDSVTLKHVTWTHWPMTTNGAGTYVTQSFATGLSGIATPLCFVKEGTRVSYGNTMNAITRSGVSFAFTTSPGVMTVGVMDTIVTTVTVIVKAYADA